MADQDRIKQLEEELRITRDRIEMAAKISTDAMWDVELENESVWVNKNYGDLFGEMPPVKFEVAEQHWTERVHPDDLNEVKDKKHSALTDTSIKNWDEEYRFQHSDGHYINISDRAYISRDANGAAVRVIGVVQDITERKTFHEKQRILETQIQQAQKLESLGVLAGGIAHDKMQDIFEQ